MRLRSAAAYAADASEPSRAKPHKHIDLRADRFGAAGSIARVALDAVDEMTSVFVQRRQDASKDQGIGV
ncbi:hypothetical protein [Thiocystis violacea]|uniref:hypothetical protein n=1 Tax=Thiocystis violacea TaxID=13725 RepID=UPI00190381AC|nr:hypothetical protein [Thiocystis violacea]MBK1721157.1 hypothetical protein [Thiocystis violacea]